MIPACNREAPVGPVDTSQYVTSAALPAAPGGAAPAALPQFVEVTQAAGVTFVHRNGAFGKIWMPETLGSGGGFFDFDGDGHPDLLLINGGDWPGHAERCPQPSPELYLNDGQGRFRNVTHEVGLDAIHFYGMGFAAADYDGDGDTDLFLTGVGRSFLLQNEQGRFVDVTRSRLEYDPSLAAPDDVPDWSLGAVWLDYDLDGDLDLFVCNYVCWTPETDIYTERVPGMKSYATPAVYRGQTSRLFQNDGAGRLVEVTAQAGVLNRNGKSMGVIVEDFNGDFLPDLFVTNDTEANFLYLNRGGGRFEDVALAAGCGYDEAGRARAGMGTWSADVTGRGDIAVAIGNFSREPVSLYRRVAIGRGDAASASLPRPTASEGYSAAGVSTSAAPGPPAAAADELVFVDGAAKARLSRPTLLMLTFGVVFADFDLDGLPDLMLANGHIEPQIQRVQKDVTFAQPPQLFRNTGETFDDLSDQVGADFSRPAVARGLATADIDGDGDLDVLLTVNDGSARLLRNDLPPGANALRFVLRGAGRNPQAIGAVVTVTCGERTQSQRVRTGGSYLSQSELPLTFGLGAAARADVQVRWPTGRSESLGELEAAHEYVVTEGHGATRSRPLRRQGVGDPARSTGHP
jgi:hypothetical protein